MVGHCPSICEPLGSIPRSRKNCQLGILLTQRILNHISLQMGNLLTKHLIIFLCPVSCSYSGKNWLFLGTRVHS